MLQSQIRKWYYVGSTNRIKERLSEHNSGKVTSTKAFKPFKMVFSKEFDSETKARGYERKLKDKRIEKERLIHAIENNQ